MNTLLIVLLWGLQCITALIAGNYFGNLIAKGLLPLWAVVIVLLLAIPHALLFHYLRSKVSKGA